MTTTSGEGKKKKTKMKKFLGFYYYQNAPKSDFRTQKPLVDLYEAFIKKIN